MRTLLAVVLAMGLVPLPSHTTHAYAEGSDGQTAVLSDEVRASIDQSEEDGTCTAGQALVVYHASGAAKGSTGTLSVQSDSNPLASAGFAASNEWDLSKADALESANAAASDGALSVQSEATGLPIASGSDVRVALVERDGMSVANLVAALESLDFVECAQPNYVTTEDALAAADGENPPVSAEEIAAAAKSGVDSSTAATTVSTAAATTAPSSSPATLTSSLIPQTLVTQSPASQNTITNDAYNSLQWGLSGTNSEIAGSTAGIGYATALAKDTPSTTTKDSVVVAILDDGVDYTNPDLKDQMWTDPGTIGLGTPGSHGYNGVTGEYDPMPANGSSHGTHCAGIAAAATNNGIGVASTSGASGHTQIMGLRHEDSNGYLPTSATVACYEYLVRARAADVNVVAVNCSFGVPTASEYDPVRDYVINQAGKAGILSCFSAGNTGTDTNYDYSSACLESPYYISVASSTKDATLSMSSCYDQTAVDVAAPGTNILSTVPSASSTEEFVPLLSYKAGKTTKAQGMYYYTDIASLGTSGISYQLYDAEEKQFFTCDGAVTLDATGTLFESNALKVTYDCDKITAAGHDPNHVAIVLSWPMDNPFRGATDTNPSHYALGLAVTGIGFAGREAVWAVGGLISSATNLVQGDSYVSADADTYWLTPAPLTSLDTTSDTLTAQVSIEFGHYAYSSSDPAIPSTGTWSCLLTGYGVGKTTDPSKDAASAFVPYTFMSGTSMAAPMITGSIAELAALYPTYTPLQLRGLVCGGTEKITTTGLDCYGNVKHIASDGRFTFDDALDDSKVNANTWSITTSGNQVTVHGYNLSGAKLYVDDTSRTTVTATGTQADSITFTAASSLFDGKAHRFDVVDGTTQRYYNASYVTPDSSKDTLARIGDLPTTESASTSQLVSTVDRLFYADGQGTYLYSCTTPSDPISSWTKLTAPGATFTERTAKYADIEYACTDGTLYAFAAGDGAALASGTAQLSLRCNTYSIASGTWSGWKEIGTVDSYYLDYLSASTVNGMVCCYLHGWITEDSSYSLTYAAKAGTTDFSARSVDEIFRSLNSAGDTLLYSLASYSVETTPETYAPGVISLDPTTGKTNEVGRASGFAPSPSPYTSRSEANTRQTGTGNGFVTAGISDTNLGDMQLIGTDAQTTKLGDFGFSAADGLTVGSMVMYDGKLYLNCIDHSTENGTKTGLYTLPNTAASKLTTNDATLTASAQAGGTATVSDWRENAGSSLVVRMGDTATWKAEAAAGYSFDGWYGPDDKLVSSDATYSAPVVTSTTLTAHFKAHEYTISFDKNASDATGTMTSQPTTYGTSTVLATCAFNRPGYFFAGWNTEADGSGTSYANGATVESLSSYDGANVKLFAQWGQKKETNGVTAVLVGSGKSIRDLVIEPRAAVSATVSSAIGTRELQSDWDVYFTDGTTENFGTLELTFPAAGGTVQVWEVHSGRLFKDGDQAVSNGTASATVTTLSEFAVTSATDAVVAPATTVSPTTVTATAVATSAAAATTTPSTGDGSDGALSALPLAAMGAALVALGARRKRSS